jgi:hypothetical protein
LRGAQSDETAAFTYVCVYVCMCTDDVYCTQRDSSLCETPEQMQRDEKSRCAAVQLTDTRKEMDRLRQNADRLHAQLAQVS